jgi:hypothetical protein
MPMTEDNRLNALKWSLRVWGVFAFLIFVPLFTGFAVQTPLIDTGGVLNWTIWNGVACGDEPCHVPPMLFVIYIVWGVFALLAARNPYRYLSFITFTMWANLAHALLMTVQALSLPGIYWSKFLTDIPYIGLIAVAIFLFKPKQSQVAAGRLEAA